MIALTLLANRVVASSAVEFTGVLVHDALELGSGVANELEVLERLLLLLQLLVVIFHRCWAADCTNNNKYIIIIKLLIESS
jgi:hypothetical protein